MTQDLFWFCCWKIPGEFVLIFGFFPWPMWVPKSIIHWFLKNLKFFLLALRVVLLENSYGPLPQNPNAEFFFENLAHQAKNVAKNPHSSDEKDTRQEPGTPLLHLSGPLTPPCSPRCRPPCPAVLTLFVGLNNLGCWDYSSGYFSEYFLEVFAKIDVFSWCIFWYIRIRAWDKHHPLLIVPLTCLPGTLTVRIEGGTKKTFSWPGLGDSLGGGIQRGWRGHRDWVHLFDYRAW